jgi:hypothetical protein
MGITAVLQQLPFVKFSKSDFVPSGDNSFKSAGKSAIPPDKNNDFTHGVGSQRPT